MADLGRMPFARAVLVEGLEVRVRWKEPPGEGAWLPVEDPGVSFIVASLVAHEVATRGVTSGLLDTGGRLIQWRRPAAAEVAPEGGT